MAALAGALDAELGLPCSVFFGFLYKKFWPVSGLLDRQAGGSAFTNHKAAWESHVGLFNRGRANGKGKEQYFIPLDDRGRSAYCLLISCVQSKGEHSVQVQARYILHYCK